MHPAGNPIASHPKAQSRMRTFCREKPAVVVFQPVAVKYSRVRSSQRRLAADITPAAG
jgi:hypothetical protein